MKPMTANTTADFGKKTVTIFYYKCKRLKSDWSCRAARGLIWGNLFKLSSK